MNIQTITSIKQFKIFAHKHDQLLAFHVAYLLLTLCTAAFLNLGAFLVMIFIHMGLDIVKYRDFHKFNWSGVLRAVLHESLADLSLLSLGLVFCVYLHHSVSAVVWSALLHTEVTIIRFMAMLIPKYFILEHLLKIFSHLDEYLHSVHGGMIRSWRLLDSFYVLTISLCCSLILLAPFLLKVDLTLIRSILMWELVPWNI